MLMTVRLLLVALLGVMLASAKTYRFTLSNPSQAGSTKLDAGQYTLKLNGSKVMLENADGKTLPTTAKVETADKTYRDTEVSTTTANGNRRIEWIGLAGSKAKIVFE